MLFSCQALAEFAEIKKKADRFEHDLKSAINNERKAMVSYFGIL